MRRRRRLLWIALSCLSALLALAVRTFWLMLFPDATQAHSGAHWQDSAVGKADLEHFRVWQTDDARGRILYRNGQPWSGDWRVVTGPNHERIGVHSERTAARVNPIVGAVGLPDVWPDPKRAVQEQGRSGLEYTFDHVLAGRRPGYVAQLADPSQRALSTDRYTVQPVSGADVQTTIDPAWQRLAEAALNSTPIRNGAVVVLDVADNEALAMAGRDNRHPGLVPVLTAQTPGSVFKLVTATAALDSYMFRPTDHFVCKGAVERPGVHMRCWTRHGEETLVRAIAESCDVTFADVGWRLGRTGLLQAARQLRLDTTHLQKVDGAPVLPGAETAVVLRHVGSDAGLLANTAIGQEDVRLTPLQAANLARTVANHGRMRPVRLVQFAGHHGVPARIYTTPGDQQAMSPMTAYWIGQGMRLAVTSPRGTAHALAPSPVTSAVKTGTAELPNGRVNGWMVGYAPADHPQIAFCVFVGDEPSARAHQAVADMTKQLLRGYRQFQGPSHIG